MKKQVHRDPLEETLKDALLLAAPRVIPNMRLFVRARGVGKTASGNVVSFGLDGQCDLTASVKNSGGRTIEIELKKSTGRLRPDQEVWRDFCRAWGIPWILLQGGKGETVDQTIKRWFVELRPLVDAATRNP